MRPLQVWSRSLFRQGKDLDFRHAYCATIEGLKGKSRSLFRQGKDLDKGGGAMWGTRLFVKSLDPFFVRARIWTIGHSRRPRRRKSKRLDPFFVRARIWTGGYANLGFVGPR